jgi:hypothetical protein
LAIARIRATVPATVTIGRTALLGDELDRPPRPANGAGRLFEEGDHPVLGLDDEEGERRRDAG